MASVLQRTAIGACLIVALCGLLFLDVATGHAYGVIVVAITLVAAGLRELVLILRPLTTLPGVALPLAGATYAALKGLGYEFDPRLHAFTGPLAVACAYGLFFAALRGSPAPERLRSLMATVFCFVYVAFLGSYALDVRFLSPDWGTAAFLYVVAIAKGTDICAFFTGKAFGRSKLVPSVSPGKTTAGFVGAVLGGALITCVFSQFTSLGAVLTLPLAPGIGIVMALVVISGDLIESFMKRSLEVKDSATLLPGFGGVMDIVDSVVIAAPAVYYLLLGLSSLPRVNA